MMSWKKNFDGLTQLFQVGPYVMTREDLEEIGFDLTLLKPTTDPWASPSDYDLQEVKNHLQATRAKAFKVLKNE